MKKLFLLILVVVIFIIGLTGCSSSMESSKLMDKYYDNIKNHNFDEDYDFLSSASKTIWTKENYNKFESIVKEAFIPEDVKIEKKHEYKDKELDGINYSDVIEYNVTEFYHDNYHDKDGNSNFVIYTVKENNQWKIYKGKEDVKGEISESKCSLAVMYFTGKGENKDISKAQDIINESIQENPDYGNSYYLLCCMDNSLKRYDDAISIGEQNIDRGKTNEERSNQYYMIGCAYEGKEDYIKSKDYYTQSLDTNPNNEDAKSSLSKLNSELGNK